LDTVNLFTCEVCSQSWTNGQV